MGTKSFWLRGTNIHFFVLQMDKKIQFVFEGTATAFLIKNATNTYFRMMLNVAQKLVFIGVDTDHLWKGNRSTTCNWVIYTRPVSGIT